MTLIQDWKEFIELLNSHEVQYLIVGGWAINHYLIPRVTGDIDFFVSNSTKNQKKLRKVLKAFGFGSVLSPDDQDLLPPKRILMLGRQPTRIDIMSGIDGVTFEEAWANRVSASLDNIPVFLISPELLLLNKGATGRLKDTADAEGLKKLLSEK
jgi:Nucleotidyl transferase of unknown function (DUF2204)